MKIRTIVLFGLILTVNVQNAFAYCAWLNDKTQIEKAKALIEKNGDVLIGFATPAHANQLQSDVEGKKGPNRVQIKSLLITGPTLSPYEAAPKFEMMANKVASDPYSGVPLAPSSTYVALEKGKLVFTNLAILVKCPVSQNALYEVDETGKKISSLPKDTRYMLPSIGGYYGITDEKTGRFKDIGTIDIRRVGVSTGDYYEGKIYSRKNMDKIIAKFKSDRLVGRTLSFETTPVQGTTYKFTGTFTFDPTNFSDFEAASGNGETPMTGHMTKITNGKVVEEADVDVGYDLGG